MAEKIAITIMACTLFLTVGTVARAIIGSWRRLRLARMQTELQHKLLDKLSGAGDLAKLIESEAGQRFLAAATAEIEARSKAASGSPASAWAKTKTNDHSTRVRSFSHWSFVLVW